MRIAILKCQKLPSFVTWEIPNVDALFEDDRLLIAEFAARGVQAESVVWADSTIDWNAFDVALIRSTWDYIDAREHFLAVLAQIEASSCRLFNPLEPVRWNSDKFYLFDLNRWGVPIVPTLPAPLPASIAEAASVQAHIVRNGWGRVVVKPSIGAGAADVHLVSAGEVGETLARVSVQRPGQAFLVQPLIESVLSEGEWSFIFVDGALMHTLLKKPAAGDYRAHGIYGGTTAAVQPHPEDVRQAQTILAKLPFDLLYARLDLVRIDGALAVMELELVEPILYFALAPAGVGRLVTATLHRVGRL